MYARMYVCMYVCMHVCMYACMYVTRAQACNPVLKTENFQIPSSGFCMSPSIDAHLLRIKLNSAHSHYYYRSNYADVYVHRSYFHLFRQVYKNTNIPRTTTEFNEVFALIVV